MKCTGAFSHINASIQKSNVKLKVYLLSIKPTSYHSDYLKFNASSTRTAAMHFVSINIIVKTC